METSGKSLPSPALRAILIGMIAAFTVCTAVAARLVDFQNPAASLNLFLSAVTTAFTVLLYFFCINDVTWKRREKLIFENMVVIFFLTALSLLLASGSTGRAEMYRLTMLLNTLLYLLSSVYWIMFWFFQKAKYSHSFGEKPCGIIYLVFWGIYILQVVVNHFTGFCFFVDTNGVFVVRSPLLFIMTVLWFVIYFIFAVTTRCTRKIRMTLASYSLFPLLSWLLLFVFPDTTLYLDIFSSLGIFLYLIPLYLLFFNVYLESGRLFLQREKELEESRANAMMLKISPHFIANTMSSIVALCYTDAPKAGDLASKFAGYLRDNYADMNENAMIPFSKELDHIRNYLAIEVIRFPGLCVEYDVQAESFFLPTLTVQPLVENAVRHGITKRPDASGTVKISSFEEKNNYVIRITDNGMGLDTATMSDGKKHIGIANARTRLTLLCGGTLTVSALPEGGTVCEMKIPKGNAKGETERNGHK